MTIRNGPGTMAYETVKKGLSQFANVGLQRIKDHVNGGGAVLLNGNFSDRSMVAEMLESDCVF